MPFSALVGEGIRRRGGCVGVVGGGGFFWALWQVGVRWFQQVVDLGLPRILQNRKEQ